MNDEEMDEWNDKIRKLRKYIETNFNRGCAHVSEKQCKKCILYKGNMDALDELICEFMRTEY